MKPSSRSFSEKLFCLGEQGHVWRKKNKIYLKLQKYQKLDASAIFYFIFFLKKTYFSCCRVCSNYYKNCYILSKLLFSKKHLFLIDIYCKFKSEFIRKKTTNMSSIHQHLFTTRGILHCHVRGQVSEILSYAGGSKMFFIMCVFPEKRLVFIRLLHLQIYLTILKC